MNDDVVYMQQVMVDTPMRKNILSIEHFSLRPGEMVAVVGPNGAGKSTLLRVINLLQPYRGELHLFGQDARIIDKTVIRRRSAMVFQEALLLNDTVFNNVALALKFRGISSSEIRKKVNTALANFGCDHLAGRSARALSGGEGKRVCIARGLVAESDLLLLDEPSAYLDVGIRPEIIEQIRQLATARGSAVMLVSHNFTDILQFTERVIALFDSQIVQDSSLETLIRRPANIQLAKLVGMDNILPCRVKPDGPGSCVTLANGITFFYPGQVNQPVTACCLPGDAFALGNGSASRQPALPAVVIEGRVERMLPEIGTYRLRVQAGNQCFIARIPRCQDTNGVALNAQITLIFNSADAHFV